MNKKIINLELYLLAFFIFASVIIRYYFADFPKHLQIYFDELRYLHIAESFITGRGFSIYNVDSGFQKIFYSIILSPTYLISDREITIRLISIINVLIMSSGVIPIWLLAKKIINSSTLRLIVALIYLFSADMVYTMTFMSEILFYPMALWFIYFIYQLIDNSIKYRTLHAIFVGFFLYLMYLTKEVALALLIALPILCIFSIIIFFINHKNIEIKWKSITYSTVLIIITFVIIHIIIKNTIFAGLGNSYNQMGIEILFKEGRIRYLLYGFVHYLFSCIVAFGVLPVITPMFKFNSLNLKEKNIYFFLITIILITSFVVAYTITIREDYGKIYELNPRTHLRYIGYAMYPLFVIFFRLFEYNKKENFYTTIRWVLALSIFGLIFITFWRGVTDIAAVDQILLQYLRNFSQNEIMTYCLAVTLLTLLAIIFFDKFKTGVYIIFLLCFFAIQIYNNILKINWFNNIYIVTKEQMSDTIELKKFIDNNQDKSFVFVSYLSSKCKRIMDTYINKKNMYTISFNAANDIQNKTNNLVPVNQLRSEYHRILYNLHTIDYLVLNKDVQLSLQKTDYNIVLSNECYTVYDINGSKFLPFIKDLKNISTGEYVYTPENYWPFASYFKNTKYVSTGKGTLVFGPYITLPAGKYTFEIYYTYKGKPIPQDTILGKSDIYSSKVNLDWKQYVKNFTPSSNIVRFDNIIFDKNIPNFELRMFTDIAGVKVEKIIINKLE